MRSKSTCNPLECHMILINESHYMIIIASTVTVSAIFGITWLPDVILQVVDETNSLPRCCHISYCLHDNHVQLRCQSICIRANQPVIQREDEEHVVPQTPQSDSIELVNSNVA